MIYEKTKSALSELFQSGEIDSEDPATQDDVATEEQEDKEPQPRVNGLVERNYAQHGYHLDAQVGTDQLLQAVQILDSHEFFIESITGVDWIKDGQLEVIYDFSRYDFEVCRVVIRTRIDRNKPVVPTITEIYSGANWHERETHDFFGIKFDGHPHLIPLLLPEDATFHPLLKDFKA